MNHECCAYRRRVGVREEHRLKGLVPPFVASQAKKAGPGRSVIGARPTALAPLPVNPGAASAVPHLYAGRSGRRDQQGAKKFPTVRKDEAVSLKSSPTLRFVRAHPPAADTAGGSREFTPDGSRQTTAHLGDLKFPALGPNQHGTGAAVNRSVR